MNNLIKKILVEWSYRLDDGMIDLENYTHLSILREVLSDMELPSEVIIEVMGNITEKEGESKPLSDEDKKKMSDMGLVWKGKGYGKEGEKGILFKNVDGKLVKIGDKETSDKPEKVKGQDKFAKDLEKEKEEEPLSPEKQQELNEKDSKECDKWLNMSKEESLNQSVEDEDGDGAAGDLESKAGEAVTVAGAKRVKELMTTPPKKTYEEARKIVEEEPSKENKRFLGIFPIGTFTSRGNRR